MSAGEFDCLPSAVDQPFHLKCGSCLSVMLENGNEWMCVGEWFMCQSVRRGGMIHDTHDVFDL